MTLQDRDCLVLDGLSILSDPRPSPAQPVIDEGLHMRWAFGPKRAFPLHGYHLFRRVYGEAIAPTLGKLAVLTLAYLVTAAFVLLATGLYSVLVQ